MLIRNNLSNNAVTEKNILFKPGCVFFFSPFQTAKRKEEKKKRNFSLLLLDLCCRCTKMLDRSQPCFKIYLYNTHSERENGEIR